MSTGGIAGPAVAVLVRPGELGRPDEELARRLGLPAVTRAEAGPAFLLARDGGRLEIRWNRRGGPRPLSIDFVHGPLARRFRGATSKRVPLWRAAGIGRGTRTVLDATAGLGRDAFLLAWSGCSVLAVERSPVVAALLADGLARAAGDEVAARAARRVELRCADARDVMREITAADRPDVVLLDPMLPAGGSALVKKETRLLQELLGPATPGEAEELLALARRTARARAVVKRPLRALPLAPDCAARIAGPRVRWDVYLSKGT